MIEFLEHSLRLKNKDILSHFDMMRRKRNVFFYDADMPISITEAKLAIETAERFVNLICDLLMKFTPLFNRRNKRGNRE